MRLRSSVPGRTCGGCSPARPTPSCAAAAGSSSRTSVSWARKTAWTSWCGRPASKLGREDIAFTLIGSGDCFDDLVALRDELGLAEHVEFTGRAPDELVARIMSTADAGLSPDPKNPLNDVSTMNKTMEYMAFGLPVVAFDLRETRVSAGDAAVYVQPNDERQYAEAIVALLDDEPRRSLMGKLARERVERELAWDYQESAYLGVYARVLGQVKARNRTRA